MRIAGSVIKAARRSLFRARLPDVLSPGRARQTESLIVRENHHTQEGYHIFYSFKNVNGPRKANQRKCNKFPLFWVKPCESQRTYTPDELSQPARDLAIEPILRFFELFNFADVSVEQVIKKDQDQLYGFNPNG